MTMDPAKLSCMKAVIIIFNVPIMVFGAVAIGLGIWVVVDDPTFIALTHMDELSVINESYVLNGAYVIIAGGSAIVIFGLMGVLAACSANAFMLGTYAGVISVAMCVEVAGSVLGIVFKNTWEKHLDSAIENNLKEKYDGMLNSENSFTKHFDIIQTSFQCCGFNNISDFDVTTKWNKTQDDGKTASVPPACCKIVPTNSTGNTSTSAMARADCQSNPTDDDSYASMPCKKKIEETFERYQSVIIGVAVSLVFCQLVMLIMALCMLCAKLDNSYNFKDD